MDELIIEINISNPTHDINNFDIPGFEKQMSSRDPIIYQLESSLEGNFVQFENTSIGPMYVQAAPR